MRPPLQDKGVRVYFCFFRAILLDGTSYNNFKFLKKIPAVMEMVGQGGIWN